MTDFFDFGDFDPDVDIPDDPVGPDGLFEQEIQAWSDPPVPSDADGASWNAGDLTSPEPVDTLEMPEIFQPLQDQINPLDRFEGEVIGSPDESTDLWHEQAQARSCAVVSQEFILESITGRDFDEFALSDLAERNGWFDPAVGTPANHIGDLIEAYGIPVTTSQGNLAELAQSVSGGSDVIVAVDSSEIWDPSTATNDMWFMPGGADHTVVVTGFDLSDGSNPMVVINDPGDPNGAGRHLPVEVFEQAWEDSGNLMVVANPTIEAIPNSAISYSPVPTAGPDVVDLADFTDPATVTFGTALEVDGVTESGNDVIWSTTSNRYHDAATWETVEEVW